MPYARGFTLPELLACLAIAAILLSISAPSFSSLYANNQQRVLVNQLLGALHYARGTAITTGVPITLCGGPSSCRDEAQWRENLWVFHDPLRKGELPAQQGYLRVEYLPAGYYWHWRGFAQTNFLYLRGNGRIAGMNGTFTLCRKGEALRQVVLNVTGRAREETPDNALACRAGAYA